MKLSIPAILACAILGLAAAQAVTPSERPAGRPAPAPPAAAPPGALPLAPPAPNNNDNNSNGNENGSGNALISLIKSGLALPVPTPNPVVSLIQSGLQHSPVDPAVSTTAAPPTTTPTTTYTQEPVSFALSDISFASDPFPSPSPSSTPSSTPTDQTPNSTPGTILLCTSTTYTSWSGDSVDTTCDVMHGELQQCRNVSAALRGRVVAVRPDKGQVCTLFDGEGCAGEVERVGWPGVRNLRGRVGGGGGGGGEEWAWAGRVASWRCEGV